MNKKDDYLALIADIEAVEQRAMRMKAIITGRALNRAKNALGWEIGVGDLKQAAKAAVI